VSQTPAESSGEREIVVSDCDNLFFCYTLLFNSELTFFLTISQFILEE